MKEILTYKSGKFRFCDEYDEKRISTILVEANVLAETVLDLPILPEFAAKLEPEIMYSSISGTASIEGNPIPEEDVREIAEGKDPVIYTRKHKQEIKNLIAAYKILSQFEPSEEPMVIDEKLIKHMHETITAGIIENENVPGSYRNCKVMVGDKAHGGIYTPPKILDDIKMLMSEFIEWINSEEMISKNPFIRSSLAHYHFCLIHPFGDGNGRTARIIEAIILQSANIKYAPKVISNYYYRNVDDYYIAFSETIKLKNDVTPFLEFMLKASVSSLKGIKDNLIFFIRKFALRDFFAFQKRKKYITSRQFDLLSLLLDRNAEFSLNDLFEKRPFNLLYRKVTTQTARRDLKKLSDMDILLKMGNNYTLNYRMLG